LEGLKVKEGVPLRKGFRRNWVGPKKGGGGIPEFWCNGIG